MYRAWMKLLLQLWGYPGRKKPWDMQSGIVWGVYNNIAYEGTGTFSSCDGTYNMNFTITVDEGSFGAFPFTFTRND